MPPLKVSSWGQKYDSLLKGIKTTLLNLQCIEMQNTIRTSIYSNIKQQFTFHPYRLYRWLWLVTNTIIIVTITRANDIVCLTKGLW